jgi:hypothetical protein
MSRIETYGLIKGLNGFIVLTQDTESIAFIIPGRGIFWIQPDGLIVSFDGFVVFALAKENVAFVVPGYGIIGI